MKKDSKRKEELQKEYELGLETGIRHAFKVAKEDSANKEVLAFGMGQENGFAKAKRNHNLAMLIVWSGVLALLVEIIYQSVFLK